MKIKKFFEDYIEYILTFIIVFFFLIVSYFAYLETTNESIYYDSLQEKIKIIEHTYGRDFSSYNEYLVYRLEAGE